MIELTLGLWLSASGLGDPTIGAQIPPGVYPAAVLLSACQLFDEKPMVFRTPELARRAVRLPVGFRISPETLPSMQIALRTAGVHRVAYSDAAGSHYTFVTDDPTKAPREALPYQVKIVYVHNVEPSLAAKVLNTHIARRESSLEAGQLPTRFVVGPRPGQLVIRYTSRKRLQEYYGILADLDRPQKSDRTTTYESYLVKHRMADDLTAEFMAVWRKKKKEPITLVPNRSTNAILIGVSKKLWPEAEAMLQALDRPKIKNSR